MLGEPETSVYSELKQPEEYHFLSIKWVVYYLDWDGVSCKVKQVGENLA